MILVCTTSRPQTMLVVARLADTQKRISDVIQALSQLPSSWTLDIVGTGRRTGTAWLALADRLGVADRVHFVGFVTDPVDLRERYRACGVAVMASAQEKRAAPGSAGSYGVWMCRSGERHPVIFASWPQDSRRFRRGSSSPSAMSWRWLRPSDFASAGAG